MRTATYTLALLLPALSGCGLEALFFNAGQPDNSRPVTRIEGIIPLDAPRLRVIAPDGSDLEVVDSRTSGGTFSVSVPSSTYDNLRLEAVQGEARLLALVTRAEPESAVGGLVVDELSTMQALLVEGRLTAESTTLLVVTPEIIDGLRGAMAAAVEEDGPARNLLLMIERISAAADRSAGDAAPLNLVDPVLDDQFHTTTSALGEAWLASVEVDYTGDMMVDTSSAAFNAAFEAAVRIFGFEGCLDPVNIRVVFTTNFNAGQKDGNCDEINRFRWALDEPGKSMFFVGGVHPESPIQDPELDAQMSNSGGWVPNQVHMYDDGTNGDEVSEDNIWTISFVMPRGIRVGYKYTWGKQGALWTGSEEWPGNQHILEIVDVNGDNIVYRADNFGEEATNKDKVNLYRRGMGVVTWDTDANGDGVPDARERMVDLDNDCTLDTWVTPAGVGPVTVDCEPSGP